MPTEMFRHPAGRGTGRRGSPQRHGMHLNKANSGPNTSCPQASVAELVLRVLDWMGDHKSTWESAKSVWELLRSVMPPDAGLTVFKRVKAVLVAHLDGRLRIVHVCPCEYTV